ncbi:hypothetical protein HPB50_017094 [Hyalomma asiaticum]|uniref:Uncharacterized protein n=1 Tax=Hyalomma asiaticum TaxID=266040 RepID=A0ACB7TLB1_HYAAI|nr:hypothetical protein HPB50_017094 [Hyalomma asiaticum]
MESSTLCLDSVVPLDASAAAIVLANRRNSTQPTLPATPSRHGLCWPIDAPALSSGISCAVPPDQQFLVKFISVTSSATDIKDFQPHRAFSGRGSSSGDTMLMRCLFIVQGRLWAPTTVTRHPLTANFQFRAELRCSVSLRFEAIESRLSALEPSNSASGVPKEMLDGFQSAIESLSDKVIQLTAQNGDLENRLRRNNLAPPRWQSRGPDHWSSWLNNVLCHISTDCTELQTAACSFSAFDNTIGRMGGALQLYEQLSKEAPPYSACVPWPGPQHVDVRVDIPGISAKRRTPK